MELPWSTPGSPAGKSFLGGQGITPVLVWHPGAQFIQREMHGFVSSFKGKTPSQAILAPCTSHVLSLLCIIPSSPCCSLKCAPGKPPSAPWIWKSDTPQAHGGGLRFCSFFSCFSDGPLWSLPMGWAWWDGSWEETENWAGQIHTLPFK